MKTRNLFITLCLTATSAFGQINLESSYTTDCFIASPMAFNVENGTKFYNLSAAENKVMIYNQSHVLEKSITLTVSSGFNLESILLPCDKLFNTDSKIEFIAVFSSDPVLGNNEIKTILFNEDGTNLKEFGDRREVYYIKTINNLFKLITVCNNNEDNNATYDVYSLPGILSDSQQSLLDSKELKAFPNPVSNILNVNNILKAGEKGNLEIFNETGVKVFQKNIDSNETTISIDISSLKRGLYIYRINNISDKFIKR